ncbi:hypothetical protein J3R83DRAFT_4126 [Lanmaoa asiatica]|nr:hypothetical protein J3R83DRAFT_4126 [Lanmaoa asiatica]
MSHCLSSRIPEPSLSSTHNCNSPSLRMSSNEYIQRAMDILQQGRLSLLTALIKVLDPLEKDFAVYRNKVYACPKGQPTGKLGKLLDTIHDDPRGRSQLLSWMEPHGIKQLTKKVHDEMDTVKECLRLKITSITPELLATWDITSAVGETIRQHAPMLREVLYSAAQTERATRENTSKDCHIVGININLFFADSALISHSLVRVKPCLVLITQLAKMRSHYSLYFAVPFTLFLWTNGQMVA